MLPHAWKSPVDLNCTSMHVHTHGHTLYAFSTFSQYAASPSNPHVHVHGVHRNRSAAAAITYVLEQSSSKRERLERVKHTVRTVKRPIQRRHCNRHSPVTMHRTHTATQGFMCHTTDFRHALPRYSVTQRPIRGRDVPSFGIQSHIMVSAETVAVQRLKGSTKR